MHDALGLGAGARSLCQGESNPQQLLLSMSFPAPISELSSWGQDFVSALCSILFCSLAKCKMSSGMVIVLALSAKAAVQVTIMPLSHLSQVPTSILFLPLRDALRLGADHGTHTLLHHGQSSDSLLCTFQQDILTCTPCEALLMGFAISTLHLTARDACTMSHDIWRFFIPSFRT